MSFLIVLEGIDKFGGRTHSDLLRDFLGTKGKNAAVMNFPDYGGPFGQTIYDYTHGKVNLSLEEVVFTYVGEMKAAEHKIMACLSSGTPVILNRYLHSTIAYQSVQGFDADRIVSYARKVNIPEPDLVFVIDISPEESFGRVKKDGNLPDNFEKDTEFLKKVREKYREIVSNKIFGKNFILISGERSKEEVQNEIRAHVENLLAAR